jgi:hypothetical protein
MSYAQTLGNWINRGESHDFELRKHLVFAITKDDVEHAANTMLAGNRLYAACVGRLSAADKRVITKLAKFDHK